MEKYTRVRFICYLLGIWHPEPPWCPLAFQPYFTANATNVGYTCWSHDIGGFKTGVRARELFIRWMPDNHILMTGPAETVFEGEWRQA